MERYPRHEKPRHIDSYLGIFKRVSGMDAYVLFAHKIGSPSDTITRGPINDYTFYKPTAESDKEALEYYEKIQRIAEEKALIKFTVTETMAGEIIVDFVTIDTSTVAY